MRCFRPTALKMLDSKEFTKYLLWKVQLDLFYVGRHSVVAALTNWSSHEVKSMHIIYIRYSLTPPVVCSTWRPHFNCDLVENDLIALLQADHQYSNKPSFSLAATSIHLPLFFFLSHVNFWEANWSPCSDITNVQHINYDIRGSYMDITLSTSSYVVGLYRYEKRADFCGHPELPELNRSSLVTYNPTDLVL